MKKIIAAVLVISIVIVSLVIADMYLYKDYKLDKKTGVVTVSGMLDERFITHFLNDKRVKSIVAEEGCELPENCNMLFSQATKKMPNLQSIDLSKADTSNVNNACNMFFSCSGLKTLVVTGFDTSNITNMCGMFAECSSIESLDLSSFDTSKVTTMSGMFMGCGSLKSLDLSSFDTSKVEFMSDMFSGCKGLTEINLMSFDTSRVSEMDRMFYNCYSLSVIDMSSFDSSSLERFWDMFTFCTALETIYVNGSWKTPNVDTDMFAGCYQLVGGKGWHYYIVYTTLDGDSKYAKVDQGKSDPGFFTLKE